MNHHQKLLLTLVCTLAMLGLTRLLSRSARR